MAAALWDLQKRTGRSWVDLSAEIGISLTTLHYVKAEERDPLLKVVKTIARYFEWTPEQTGLAVLHIPLCLRGGVKAQRKPKLQRPALPPEVPYDPSEEERLAMARHFGMR